MSKSSLRYHSNTSATDTVHTVSLAAPIFLVLLGCYILYENLIPVMVERIVVLMALLAGVAILAPFGGRLTHLEMTDQACRVIPTHTAPYEIAFNDIERFSISPWMGVVKLTLHASEMLPRDSVWFIPEIPNGKSKREELHEIQEFLKSHIKSENEPA